MLRAPLPSHVSSLVAAASARLPHMSAATSEKRRRLATQAHERLSAFRERLTASKLDAFLVGSGDAHNSEYVAERDKRRGYATRLRHAHT